MEYLQQNPSLTGFIIALIGGLLILFIMYLKFKIEDHRESSIMMKEYEEKVKKGDEEFMQHLKEATKIILGIMTEQKVKELLEKEELKWEDFMQWMQGRTISEDKNGNAIFNNIDVVRFFYIHNKSIYLDLQHLEK